jgi:hypothetical protein
MDAIAITSSPLDDINLPSRSGIVVRSFLKTRSSLLSLKKKVTSL